MHCSFEVKGNNFLFHFIRCDVISKMYTYHPYSVIIGCNDFLGRGKSLPVGRSDVSDKELRPLLSVFGK